MTGKKIRKTFPTLAAAKGWRADAMSAIRKGALHAQSRQTVRDAAEEHLWQIVSLNLADDETGGTGG